ncbi:Polysaccharide export outer membrane protein [hydrothermal vent metagenome]|uniref:Polysaccharide export outer membrane protein n=1 Tax=hydrothermal vent metagenome TaxID=652676 RepID=A0A1W1C2H1_9ZZZZ
MNKNLWVWSLILFFLTGCVDKSEYVLLQSDKNLSKKEVTLKQDYDYVILPHDRLLIALYRNPEIVSETGGGYGDLGQEMQKDGVLVDSKGYVFLPLIKRVKLAGLTQEEASRRISSRYKKFLKIPTVYVEVMNKRVYVIGEVNRPGPVKLDREKTTVLEAIAEAGDLTDAAVRDNIVILSRNAQHKLYMRKVDLTHFDRVSLSNMILRPNDIVYVQPDGWKEFKVSSDNVIAPFRTISEIASPFVTLKYLSNN